MPDNAKTTLRWEDVHPDAEHWWLARARETQADDGRDFFIAEDDMTGSIVGIVRQPPANRYVVLAAVFLDQAGSAVSATDQIKNDIEAVLIRQDAAEMTRVKRGLRSWRVLRFREHVRRNLPFLFLGFCVGMLLGLAVVMFTLSTGFSGWPVVAAGVVLGAAIGPLLKMLVDQYRVEAAAGPWGRLAIVGLGAIVGAGIVVGGGLTLF